MIAKTSSKLGYAILVGQGRSGTNYLSDLVNQSPFTHTRNEPEQLDESSLRKLAPLRFFVDAKDEALIEDVWDDAVYEAAMKIGPRDFMSESPKSWLFPGTREVGHRYLAFRYRVLHKLSKRRNDLAMDAREIGYPFWMTSRSRMEKIFHVFKINAAVGLTEWMLHNRPDGKAIHLIRNPHGFVVSWHKRYVEGQSWHAENARFQLMGKGIEEELKNEQRLYALAERNEEWAERLGDIASKSQIEAELWWWLYSNEHLYRVGQDNPSYGYFLFEDLCHDPAETVRRVLEFCGLPWSDWLAHRMVEMSPDAGKIADAWTEKITDEMREAVAKVLEGSAIAHLWD